jgi:hypothetical protein
MPPPKGPAASYRKPWAKQPRQAPERSDRRNWQPAIPIIQFGLPSFKIASGHLAAPIRRLGARSPKHLDLP